MIYQIESYDGHDLQDATFQAYFPYGMPIMPDVDVQWASRARQFAKLAGKEISGATLEFNVICTGNIHQNLETLCQWFPVDDFTLRELIISEITGSTTPGKQWSVMAFPAGPVTPAEDGPSEYVIKLAVDEPFWKSDNTDTWNVTASGQTRNVTVLGNRYARPVLSVSPTSARSGGYSWKRFVGIVNRTSKVYADALNLVDGDWDTAALTPTKMLASGDDCRTYFDLTGQEVYRWFGGGGMDTTTTRLFVNVSLPPKISLTLNGAISNVGSVSTINVKNTTTNKAALKLLATQAYKVLVIDMGGAAKEYFTYTGVNINALQITGVTRAAKLSTNQSHADNATIYHLSAGYYVFYGNSSATAPNVDDAFKPMFDLANSTNTSHVYTDYKDSLNTARLGQWVSSILENLGKESEIYTATEYTVADSVASVMGMVINTYLVGTTPRAPRAHISWDLTHPAKFTTVSVSGKKRRNGVTFPAKVGLRVKKGAAWSAIWNESSPTAEDTWEALAAHSSVSLGGSYETISLYLQGTIGARDGYAAVEYDSVTGVLDSNNTPLISFGAETSNNFMDLRITNNTNGRWFEIHYAVPVGYHVIIDTDSLDCYIQEDGTRIPIALDDETQQEWFPFEVGVNQLLYTETGVVGVTVLSNWEDRQTL